MIHKKVLMSAAALLLIGGGCTGGADAPVEEGNNDVMEDEVTEEVTQDDVTTGDVSAEVQLPEVTQGEESSDDATDADPIAAPVSEDETEVSDEETVPETVNVTVFTITGRNFEFSESEMRVSLGDTVRINFTSESGFHDWTVDEFDAKTSRVSGGGSTSVEFVADRVGSFEYYCSVGSHRQLGMVGTLIVE